MANWATREDARANWQEAAALTDGLLDGLLTAAHEMCQDYAPTLAEGAPVPFRYKLAVIYQARDLRRVGFKPGDPTNPTEVYETPEVVRALLRPRRAVPSFGTRRTTT